MLWRRCQGRARCQKLEGRSKICNEKIHNPSLSYIKVSGFSVGCHFAGLVEPTTSITPVAERFIIALRLSLLGTLIRHPRKRAPEAGEDLSSIKATPAEWRTGVSFLGGAYGARRASERGMRISLGGQTSMTSANFSDSWTASLLVTVQFITYQYHCHVLANPSLPQC